MLDIQQLTDDLKNITGQNYQILTYDDNTDLLIAQMCNSPRYNKLKVIKTPKNQNLVTADWILSKTQSDYKNLRPLFQKLELKGNIYFTSFGFSYDMFFKSQSDFDRDTKAIKQQLDDLGIKYTNEYSDARWVYRFKISKTSANLAIIKAL